MTTEQSRATLCQNAAFRLQAEAYAAQSKNGTKKLRQFNPCPKGLAYTKELADGNQRAQSLVWNDVYMTSCDCHSSITMNKLIEYENDKTFNPYSAEDNK